MAKEKMYLDFGCGTVDGGIIQSQMRAVKPL